MINCFTPVYTKENPSEADLEAVRMTSGINNRWWLDLITKGELPADVLDSLAEGGVKLPFRAGDQEILKQGVVDWLGCNYYHPTRVQAPASKIDQYGLPHFADEYVWPDAVMNESRGWEIYPQGLYDFGMDCAKNYPDLEWFVSENGIGIMDEYKNRDAEGTIQDDYRVDFVRQHLEWVAKAISEGAKCRGYHYWAVIDNWSWRMPLRTVTVLSRSTLWTVTSAALRSRQLGSSRSPRLTWLISERANAQTARRCAQHMAHLVAEGARPPCA